MKFTSTAVLSAAVLATSVLSSPIVDLKERQGPEYYEFDDSFYYPGGNSIGNSQLDYTKSSSPWTHLTNQGHKLRDGTESYTGVNGQVYIYNPYDSNGDKTLRIYSTKKSDRGAFNIYCGKTLIGSGDQHSSGAETDSVLVAEIKNYVCSEREMVMKNDRGAKFMALDYVGFYSKNY